MVLRCCHGDDIKSWTNSQQEKSQSAIELEIPSSMWVWTCWNAAPRCLVTHGPGRPWLPASNISGKLLPGILFLLGSYVLPGKARGV